MDREEEIVTAYQLVLRPRGLGMGLAEVLLLRQQRTLVYRLGLRGAQSVASTKLIDHRSR